ncbi:MAG TPA: DUF4402 domain-containing protein [Bacteroidales bacterium]|nr:DUF4402 domain-containing protein [Bacteroidota bacterium]MZP65399.1 DUF4402 domain-containing protein [Bacteroidales bacterium]HNY51954.1 DUF4402 domain-containing protein [Bacteroidales bacterium]HOG56179.1 DUF4402 domain-containing protein [Bacteroidales bacterium]HPB12675.1 DUF4402 domain-containing protein [Bacteroidales bacterium]
MTAKLKIFLSLGFLVLFNLSHTHAQGTLPIGATGHVYAEIIPVFSANEITRMNFGRFSPGPQGGRIVLSPQGTVSVQGSIVIGVGSHNAASFAVTGDEDASYSISLPTDPVLLRHTSSEKSMLIEEWNSWPLPGPGNGRLQNGIQMVNVGATLKVGTIHDNPAGVYTGTYIITFDFN